VAKDQNPHHDDARPQSEHSPPADRGGRSWKIGVTIGYGALFSTLMFYSMAHDKDVLLTFLAGAAVLLLLILFVWHPEHIGRLRLMVNFHRGFLRGNLDTPQRKRSQEVTASTRTRRSGDRGPDEILGGTDQLAARKDELKSKRSNGNSVIRKGRKLKSR